MLPYLNCLKIHCQLFKLCHQRIRQYCRINLKECGKSSPKLILSVIPTYFHNNWVKQWKLSAMIVCVRAQIRTEHFLIQVRSVSAWTILLAGLFVMYISSDTLGPNYSCDAPRITYYWVTKNLLIITIPRFAPSHNLLPSYSQVFLSSQKHKCGKRRTGVWVQMSTLWIRWGNIKCY
jgi:hypothetical protein